MQAEDNLLKNEADATELGQVNQKNNEDTSEKYRFTLLREEAVETDSFEDGTHDKIAETLYKLITKEKEGVTIGLEGAWGSGKSAVISILGKKLKDEKKIHFFTFDAWAHEGDPLRRIFLESLIESFSSKNKNLEELQSKIAKRLKTSTITSNKSVTGLGVLLAIAALFVPIGAILLTKVNFENLTFELGGKIYWLCLISMSMVSAPIFVLICNLLCLLKNKKKILVAKNWAFMKGKSTETIKQEVSEDNERSSIEFENYFKEIMTELLGDEANKKLVMVIDNLDRIDPDDSLKIWSTLQTFLQQRNTPASTQSWFEKIWIIVPYDPDGLAELWNKDKNIREGNGGEDEKGKAQFFFDKCFQLKFEVPKLILTAWERFAQDKINEALAAWDTDERMHVLNILKLTREDLNDIPTPRQIKNYINQVGLMRMHCSQEIPTRSIAYYVIRRLLKRQSVDSIREKLIERELPEARVLRFLPEFCSSDMAGLIFGVSPDKGQQLLLKPEIAKALKAGDGEKLREIQEKHSGGFWAVFFHHTRRHNYVFEDLLPYSKAIYFSLWKEFKDKLCDISLTARRVISENEEFGWPEENTLESYSCLSEILKSSDSCKHLYNKLVNSLNLQIESNNQFDMTENLNILQKLVDIFNIDAQEKLTALNYAKFIAWAQASMQSDVPAWKWIIPGQPLASEISNNIGKGVAIPPGLKDAFDYLVKAETSEDWQELVDSCQKHIQHNNGTLAGNTHSPEVFEILFILAFNFDVYNNNIKAIINSWQFYNLAWHFRKKLKPLIALLCGKYMGRELNQFSPTQGHALNFANELKTYWNNRNKDNANKLLELLKKYNKWDFLWELGEDSKNKLVADIILLALKDEKATKLFEVEDGLQKVKLYLNLFGDNDSEAVDLFIQALISHSPLEKEIIEDAELNVIEYCEELDSVVSYSSNGDLTKSLADKLKEQTKVTWSNALKEDNYLTRLAIKINEKSKDFGLENNYADVFFDFVKDNAGDTNDLRDWQKETWQKLVSLMTAEFQQRFKYDWTKYLIDNHRTISDEIIDLNCLYCDYERVKQNVESVQDILRYAIENKNFRRLKWLNKYILSPDNGKKFKPKDYYPKTIKEPLNSLYQEQRDDLENADLIKELASKFKVKLINAAIEEENDGLPKILIDTNWRLFFNPDNNPEASKIMRFGEDGAILDGQNNNESSWRIRSGFLELLDSDGQVHSRFSYNPDKNRFSHTNGPDTGSIRKHSIRNQYMLPEK